MTQLRCVRNRPLDQLLTSMVAAIPAKTTPRKIAKAVSYRQAPRAKVQTQTRKQRQATLLRVALRRLGWCRNPCRRCIGGPPNIATATHLCRQIL